VKEGMALLSDKDQQQLEDLFSKKLDKNVKLVFFGKKIGCDYCLDTEMILKELASLSDKITFENHNFELERELREKYGVDKVPAIAVVQDSDGEKDFGIRFYGIPSGYEFSSIIESIVTVSTGETNLSDETKRALREIKTPLHIQVFVTPTCPYCPKAVVLAYKFAVESPYIRSDVVESTEFPELADKYGVYAVPKIVINDSIEFEGVLPESYFLQKVFEAISKD
jgi:glutaredoxin-like protein